MAHIMPAAPAPMTITSLFAANPFPLIERRLLFSIGGRKSTFSPRQLPNSGYDGATINANRCVMSPKKTTLKPARNVPASKKIPRTPDPCAAWRTGRKQREWLRARGIEDIECITPDLAGVPRGKMMPSSKFTSNTSLALPSAIYRHTISGEYPEETESSATSRATAT
jgi:hypothetical protein